MIFFRATVERLTNFTSLKRPFSNPYLVHSILLPAADHDLRPKCRQSPRDRLAVGLQPHLEAHKIEQVKLPIGQNGTVIGAHQQGLAHQGFGADVAQVWNIGWNQGTFEHVMVDLASKMDAVAMPDGSTLLDNSLLMFVSEAGQLTHHTGCVNFPVVTAGSAGGCFNTGLYVDYSDKTVVYDDLVETAASNPMVQPESPGLYYNQFLGSVMQAMGADPANFGTFTDFGSGEPTGGYGFHFVDADRANHYAQARTVMGEMVPVIT